MIQMEPTTTMRIMPTVEMKHRELPARAVLARKMHEKYQLHQKLEDGENDDAGNNCTISHMKETWIHHERESGERKHDGKYEPDDV